MKKLLTKLFIIIILSSSVSFADDVEDSKKFINKIASNVIEIIEANNLDDKMKEEKLIELFKNSVDIKWIGNFALGKYKNISDEQRSKYYNAFEKNLIQRYIPNFKKYNKDKSEITNVISSNKGEFLVKTKIIRPQEKTNIEVSYEIKKDENNQFKIYDIIGESISLRNTQREEFNSILSNHDVYYLTKMLEQKSNN